MHYPGCYDPIVLAHGRALLATNDDTTVVTADLRRPEDVIGHDEVRELIDFTQPVGVLLIAMTHFLRDEEREEVMGKLRESLVPGSYLAATHVTVDSHSRDAVEGVEAAYRKTPTPIFFRRHDEIARFFDGFDLVDPGLVTVDRWRPDPDDAAPAPTRWLYGGVGRRS